jgi:hypothetical protein
MILQLLPIAALCLEENGIFSTEWFVRDNVCSPVSCGVFLNGWSRGKTGFLLDSSENEGVAFFGKQSVCQAVSDGAEFTKMRASVSRILLARPHRSVPFIQICLDWLQSKFVELLIQTRSSSPGPESLSPFLAAGLRSSILPKL